MRIQEANARSAPAEWQAAEPLDPAAWIPLTELALEGFGHADTLDIRAKNLRHDLAERVLLDDIGRACVPRSVARDMFAERAQKQLDAEAREAARRAEATARGNPIRDRVRAIQSRGDAADLTDCDLPTAALANMTADDHTARMEASGGHLDEMLRPRDLHLSPDPAGGRPVTMFRIIGPPQHTPAVTGHTHGTADPSALRAARLKAEIALEQVAALEVAATVRKRAGSWQPGAAGNQTDFAALCAAQDIIGRR